jgi:hypothetical protein
MSFISSPLHLLGRILSCFSMHFFSIERSRLAAGALAGALELAFASSH